MFSPRIRSLATKLRRGSMKLLPPRKYRSGWGLACAFSILSATLATIPNIRSGAYDPHLAILTLTLIAIIWYTYFTYRAVNPYTPTYLRTSLRGMLHPAAV